MNRKSIIFLICMCSIISELVFANNKIKSLFFPGLGQYSMGYKERARSFLIRDALIWTIFISTNNFSNWYENDYKAFAELNANVDMANKDYLFSVNIGHYDSFFEYNHIMSQKRQHNKMYKENKGNEWKWNSTNNRIKFDKMRIKSVNYKKYAQFAIGGLILHRLISVIDIVYLERKKSKFGFKTDFQSSLEQIEINFIIDL